MNEGPITLISPHHDDVALSVSMTAAWMLERGLDVRIVNCFTRSRFAPGMHLQGEDEVSAQRLNEEQCFVRALGSGASVTSLEFRDASLRCPGGIRDIFRSGELSADDRNQVPVLSAAIGAVSSAGPIIMPLAVGHHVDHRLARDAGLLAGTMRPLAFYEDLPYAARCDTSEITAVVDGLAGALLTRLLPVVVRSAKHLRAKEGWMAFYRSQLSETARQTVVNYSRACGGERLWVTAIFRRLLVRWCLADGESID